MELGLTATAEKTLYQDVKSSNVKTLITYVILDLMYRYNYNQEHIAVKNSKGMLYLKGNYYSKVGDKYHLIALKQCSHVDCNCTCSCCINEDTELDDVSARKVLNDIDKEARLSDIMLHIRDCYARDTSTPTRTSDAGETIIGTCTRLTDIYIKDGKNINMDWTLAYAILDDSDRKCKNKFCRCDCKCCKQLPFEMDDRETRIFHQWLAYAELLDRYKLTYIADLDPVQEDMALHPEDFLNGLDLAKLNINLDSIDTLNVAIYDTISPWSLALTSQCPLCNNYDNIMVTYKNNRVDLCLHCLRCTEGYRVVKGALIAM